MSVVTILLSLTACATAKVSLNVRGEVLARRVCSHYTLSPVAIYQLQPFNSGSLVRAEFDVGRRAEHTRLEMVDTVLVQCDGLSIKGPVDVLLRL